MRFAVPLRFQRADLRTRSNGAVAERRTRWVCISVRAAVSPLGSDHLQRFFARQRAPSPTVPFCDRGTRPAPRPPWPARAARTWQSHNPSGRRSRARSPGFSGRRQIRRQLSRVAEPTKQCPAGIVQPVLMPSAPANLSEKLAAVVAHRHVQLVHRARDAAFAQCGSLR